MLHFLCRFLCRLPAQLLFLRKLLICPTLLKRLMCITDHTHFIIQPLHKHYLLVLWNIRIACDFLCLCRKASHTIQFKSLYIFLCPAIFQCIFIRFLLRLCFLIFCKCFRIMFFQICDFLFRQRSAGFQLRIQLTGRRTLPLRLRLSFQTVQQDLILRHTLCILLTVDILFLFLPFQIQHLQTDLTLNRSCIHRLTSQFILFHLRFHNTGSDLFITTINYAFSHRK